MNIDFKKIMQFLIAIGAIGAMAYAAIKKLFGKPKESEVMKDLKKNGDKEKKGFGEQMKEFAKKMGDGLDDFFKMEEPKKKGKKEEDDDMFSTDGIIGGGGKDEGL